jgi:hypothetical protein
MTLLRRGAGSHPPRAREHPRAGEPWFQRLPERWRRDIADARDLEVARDAENDRQALRIRFVETGQMGVVFLLTDVVCRHATFATSFGSCAVGLIVGWIVSRFAFARFGTCALGLAAMFAAQWTLRGGLTALHMFVFFPFATACMYLGWAREERGFD